MAHQNITANSQSYKLAVWPYHGAAAFGHFGKELFEVFKYPGVTEISFNKPKGIMYKSENHFS